MKILVVDDDVTCRDLLSEILRRSSYEVLTAANGREALEILADGECQVVISDWVMPEVNGPTLCRAIRSAEQRNYVFIILLTSRDAPGDVREGLLAGADEFMIKPFTPAEVMTRVRTAERILGLGTVDFFSQLAGAVEREFRHDGAPMQQGMRHRFRYSARQWAAPCKAEQGPEIGDFVSIECRELDAAGVCFQSAEPCESDEWVVALGDGERTLFVLSEVADREIALDSRGRLVQVLDCRFLRRVHINARRLASALRGKIADDDLMPAAIGLL